VAVAIAVYLILLGGTEAGVIIPAIRAANAAIAGVLILFWIQRMPRDHDGIDRVALLALLGFLVASAMASYPRQALDAATAATGWTAAFYLGRRLAANPRTVRFALDAVGIAGLAIAFLFAVLWGATFARWGAVAGFADIPLFRIHLHPLMFRHVHVVALTALMLAPAVVQLARIRALRPVVALGCAAIVFVVLASGSRTAWLAALIASALTIGLRLTRRARSNVPSRASTLAIVSAAAGVLAVLFFTGAATPLLDRLTTLYTVAGRLQIWAGALQLWSQHPLTGTGPGSFVAALPGSDYFQANAFAPRHADNATIQLLMEGGAVAALPIALAAATIGWRVLKRAPLVAVWAIACFGFASLTDNPTDTAGLNAALIFWLALALPSSARTEHQPQSVGASRLLTASAFVVAIVYASVSAASFAYQAALARAAEGDLPGSRVALELAVTLDPGLAIYRRELGLVALAQNETSHGLRHLKIALHQSPLDDVTMRAIAIAESRLGLHQRAATTARMAADLRPATIANLILAAALSHEANDLATSRAYLLQAIQIEPFLPASPSWDAIGAAKDTAVLVETAVALARERPEATLPFAYSSDWLIAMGRPSSDSPDKGPEVRSASGTISAWALLLSCDPNAALMTIRAAEVSEGASGVYWFVRAAIASAVGSSIDKNLAALAVPDLGQLLQGPPGGVSPAFDAPQDRRAYARDSLMSLPGFQRFPTHNGAVASWLANPFAAAGHAAPASRLASCR
jgi:O-antigen ligase